MNGPNGGRPVRLGRDKLPRLEVAGEIFTHYQPAMGAAATLVWLNLRYAACSGRPFDAGLLKEAGLDDGAIKEAIARLVEYQLVEEDADGFIVHEPLSREAFAARFGERAARSAKNEPHNERPRSLYNGLAVQNGAAAHDAGAGLAAGRGAAPFADESQAEPKPVMRSPLAKRRKSSRMLRLVEPPAETAVPENPDMQAVVQIYHKRIGMIGPTQYEKLRFWIEEKGLDGAVVALAIEETVRSADVPRIQYLEGILRNWYNDGIRSLADLHEKRRVSRVLSGDEGRLKSERTLEGTPNASAYQSVSAELVAKWKELYPDEYDG